MNSEIIADTLHDLDSDVYKHILDFWPSLERFLIDHVLPVIQKGSLDVSRDYTQLRVPFAMLEAKIMAKSSKDWMTRQRGITTWRDTYLLPLAYELKLMEHVENMLLHGSLRHGWISLPHSTSQLSDEQWGINVITAVKEFLHTYPYPTGQNGHIRLLHERGFCPTLKAAQSVARQWAKRNTYAAARARGAILNVLAFGRLGVLQTAGYPYAEEVLGLRKLFDTIPHLRALPETVEDIVRRHVIALHQAYDQIDPKQWRADLLTQPQNNEIRRKYREQLDLGKRQCIDQACDTILSKDIADAARWHDALINSGWDGLITCALMEIGQKPTMSLEDAQIQRLLDKNIGSLDGDAQREIATAVGHLRAAKDETGVEVPLRRLLSDSPFSRSRRNFGRTLWFSMSAIRRRHQSYRLKNRDIQRPVQKRSLIDDGDDNPFPRIAPEDKLVKAFVEFRELPDEATGRSIVRSVGWNGAIGFISKDQALRAVDPMIAQYIEFIKLGHLEGTVEYSELREQINILSQMYGGQMWSHQLVRAIYNSIPKRRRWNGGVGPIMDGVSWRVTHFQNIRRLHARWLIVVVKMRISVVDEQNKPLSDVYYVVLIIDEATERPMGCWGSVNQPTSREVGLALYQSIWHPWVPTWHLRGIPEKIRVSSELVDKQWSNIKRAAYLLITEIEKVDTPVWNGPRNDEDFDIAAYIRIFGPTRVIQRSRGALLTPERILEELLLWLAVDNRIFADHTSDVINNKYLEYGVCLPGNQTPAAGWLLPILSTGRTMPDGLVIDAKKYQYPWQSGTEDQVIQWRGFPYNHPYKRNGGFIQLNDQIFWCDDSGA